MHFRTLSADASITCAIDVNGAAYCWGENTSGRLGNGSPDHLPHHTPVQVPGGPYGAIDPAPRHVCATTTSGAIRCWGWEVFGHLGNGEDGIRSLPVRVVNW